MAKDLQIERASGELTVTSSFFAVVVVITASVALQGSQQTQDWMGPAVQWIATAFASILAVSKSWQREREYGALDGLLVTAVPRSALFFGKLLALTLFLGAIQCVVIPLVALLFAISLTTHGTGLVVVAAFGTPGIAATGTLFGAMTVRARARELLLASVVFPLLLPMLLSAVAASRAVVLGGTLAEASDYLLIMSVFDIIFVAAGIHLFGPLIEG